LLAVAEGGVAGNGAGPGVSTRQERVSNEVRPEADSHFCFEVKDEDGIARSVPYHRVKEVWKDGELIWHREH
jgi:uncharacterized protein (UPF0248 family)